MTVGHIEAMPHDELVGWKHYADLEGLGVGRGDADAMHAHVASIVAEINRNTEKRRQPFQLKEFLLWPPREPPRAEPTVEGKTAAEWQLIFAAERLAAGQRKGE